MLCVCVMSNDVKTQSEPIPCHTKTIIVLRVTDYRYAYKVRKKILLFSVVTVCDQIKENDC